MEADLLLRAARAARLTRRSGSDDFEPGLGARDVAVALGRKRLDHALAGDAGANAYLSSAGEAWPVLYVEDVVRSASAAKLVRKEPGSFDLRIMLIPFYGVSEPGRRTLDGITVASRDQVVIDAYGGIDRMPEQADFMLGRGDVRAVPGPPSSGG